MFALKEVSSVMESIRRNRVEKSTGLLVKISISVSIK